MPRASGARTIKDKRCFEVGVNSREIQISRNNHPHGTIAFVKRDHVKLVFWDRSEEPDELFQLLFLYLREHGYRMGRRIQAPNGRRNRNSKKNKEKQQVGYIFTAVKGNKRNKLKKKARKH